MSVWEVLLVFETSLLLSLLLLLLPAPMVLLLPGCNERCEDRHEDGW